MNSNYTKSIQKVLQTIEDELEFVTLEELIRASSYSYYHFHRIFKAYVGESPKKYIKRLQLEKTLQQMRVDKENITQIAIKAGYHMPSSFNKAFKEMFGINPSEYKKSYALKRTQYPNIEPQRIEYREDMHVYTMRHRGDYEDLDVPMGKFISFVTKNALLSKDFVLYAIPHDNPDITENEKLRFDICAAQTKEIEISKIDWIQSKTIKGGKYAVFLHQGHPRNLLDIYNSIFGTWLYNSNIQLRDVPIFQKFLNNKYEVNEEELLVEVYVPIEV